jgi:preprotein translocase subunit Sec61beta
MRGVRRGGFDPKVIGIVIMIGFLVIVLLLAAKRIFGTLG